MKRLLTALASVLTLALAGCSSGDTYTVKGTVADAVLPKDGGADVILQHQDDTIEEIDLKDGKFSFSGKADKEDIVAAILRVDGEVSGDEPVYATFIPEPGTVRIVLDKKSSVKGGKINKAFVGYDGAIRSLFETLNGEYETLVAEKGEDEAADELKQLQDKAMEDAKNISKEVFDANSDNALGAYALNFAMSFLSVDEIDQWLENAADFIKDSDFVQASRSAKQAVENTAEGKMFVDFAGLSPDGAEVKLSDYVGNGKYALVDFWASWCGPCRREIPNVKQVFEQYGKQVNVVGVAVWDGANDESRSVMEEYQMTWPQIFVGEDTAATEAYGINAIPHIILFAPDGTILSRGLRGAQMIDTINGLFQ